VFIVRSRASATSVAEAVVLLTVSLAMTAPMQAAVGVSGVSWYVAKWSLRPAVDIPAMKNFALWTRQNYGTDAVDGVTRGKYCASMGIAALIPNDMQRDELLDGNSDLGECRVVLLLRRDIQYDVLSARATAAKFRPVARRENAELWLRGN
jgi:hypothetical protein